MNKEKTEIRKKIQQNLMIKHDRTASKISLVLILREIKAIVNLGYELSIVSVKDCIKKHDMN